MFSWLLRPIFSQLRLVAVTDEPDRPSWENLGVASNRIFTTGSIKFDSAQASPATDERTAQFRALLESIGWAKLRILLGASTHVGEEKLFAEVYRELQTTHSDLKLILVPRHAERSQEIERDLRAAGFPCIKKSDLHEAKSDPDLSILIVNTTGELRAWLPVAEIIIMGKSFLSHGGQNPVEGIEAGKLVVCGPYMENFSALMSLLTKVVGIVQVNDGEELEYSLDFHLDHPKETGEYPERARKALIPHQASTQRTIDLLTQLQKS